MATTSEITIRFVWQSAGADMIARVKDYWQSHQALSSHVNVDERVRQLAAVAERGDRLVGVATVHSQYVAEIGREFLAFRTHVAAEARLQNVASDLLTVTFRAFEAMQTHSDFPGMYYEMANAAHREADNVAISDQGRFIHIGMTDNGWDRRLRYFGAATLTD